MTEGRRAPIDDAARFWRVAAALLRADGARIGASPRRALAERDGVTLWRHEGPGDGPQAPILFVHGLVGGPAICDLAPDRSLVADLAARGAAVHVLDWGPARRSLRWLAFEDLVLDHLAEAAAAVTAAEGRRPVVLGVCEGGLFAACLAALEPRSVAGLVLAVTPVDCHADPAAPLTRLVRSLSPAEIEALLATLRGLPGGAMGAAFAALTPARTLAKHTTGLMATDGAPDRLATFLRMERWLAERPDHPEPAARQLVIEIYHQNRLARGAFVLDGRRVDLGAITAPTLSLLGLRDHIVPPPCARAAAALVGGPHREAALDAGHVGVFVSGRARGQAAAAVDDFLRAPDVLRAARLRPPARRGAAASARGPRP